MAGQPPEDDKEAEARFNETLGRMLNTPPTPHVKKSVSESAQPKKGGGARRDPDATG